MNKIALFLFVSALAAPVSDVDWPSFRGPNGSGLANTTGLPDEFGPGTNLIWKASLPPGECSPVLTKERIFVTASSQGALQTICLERATGAMLWRQQVCRYRSEPRHKL